MKPRPRQIAAEPFWESVHVADNGLALLKDNHGRVFEVEPATLPTEPKLDGLRMYPPPPPIERPASGRRRMAKVAR